MHEIKQDLMRCQEGRVSHPHEPHMACVLLLDTSSFMSGDSINSLNKAINDFKKQTSLDELAQNRVDIAIIEFNNQARIVQDFTPLPQFQPVFLPAVGNSAMGEGINLAIDKVKERNRFYDSIGIPCYKPRIIMISIGNPTDDISAARQRIIEEESKGSHGKLKFYAIGVPGCSYETLTALTKRCIALKEAKFDGFFNWLSESMVIFGPAISERDRLTLPYIPSDMLIIPEDW